MIKKLIFLLQIFTGRECIFITIDGLEETIRNDATLRFGGSLDLLFLLEFLKYAI